MGRPVLGEREGSRAACHVKRRILTPLARRTEGGPHTPILAFAPLHDDGAGLPATGPPAGRAFPAKLSGMAGEAGAASQGQFWARSRRVCGSSDTKPSPSERARDSAPLRLVNTARRANSSW